MNASASDWIDTDTYACRRDIKRLGLDAAADYQMSLIIDREASGDDRWGGITVDDMRSALAEIAG